MSFSDTHIICMRKIGQEKSGKGLKEIMAGKHWKELKNLKTDPKKGIQVIFVIFLQVFKLK